MMLERVVVEVSAADIQRCGRYVSEAMNRAQQEGGYTLDQTLASAAFALGAAIAQRGAILHLEEPLRQALPPLVQGYETALRKFQQA